MPDGNITAHIVADTVNPEGSRLTTVVLRYPRAIHSEIMTHRVFSRNSASSRARSMTSTIREVIDNPYIPHFTRNQKGMSGAPLTGADYREAYDLWLRARDKAVASAFDLLYGDREVDSENFTKWNDYLNAYGERYKAGDKRLLNVHKQNVNRLLEPFLYHECLVSSTEWGNFFQLRRSDKAQPEIHELADRLYEAMDASTPAENVIHTPFVDEAETLDEAVLLSASKCAKISYNSLNNVDTSLELGRRLAKDRHLSPFEHCAFYNEKANRIPETLSNFHPSWIQGRKMLECGLISI